jgi:hypothetical protein
MTTRADEYLRTLTSKGHQALIHADTVMAGPRSLRPTSSG